MSPVRGWETQHSSEGQITRYTVLRDLGSAVASGGFATRGGLSAGSGPPLSDPGIEVEELTRSDVRDLMRDPSVRAVAPVMPMALIFPEGGSGAATAAGPGWGVSAVRADTSQRTGRGVTVAVLDTGIDDRHPAFAGVTLEQVDFSGSGNGDRQGHGTHCAGTVFGRDVAGTRIGVAPGVQRALIGKVLGDDGRGESVMLFQAMQWAVARGAQVISMSLGFDFPGMAKAYTDGGWPADLATSVALEAYRANLRVFDDLVSMIRSLEPFGAGTVIVAAAGNESHRDIDPRYVIGPSLPAAAEGVLSVGALERSRGGLGIARSRTRRQPCPRPAWTSPRRRREAASAF